MKSTVLVSTIAGIALSLGVCVSPCAAQAVSGTVVNGFTLTIPESSIPHPGRIHTNYAIAVPPDPNSPQPPPGAETPGSLACVYHLVKGPKGCPIATSTTVPSGGWGAI